MKKAKSLICILLFLVLLLSACGAQENSEEDEQEEARVPSSYAQDVLFPPEDHLPAVETDGHGGEWMSEWGVARNEAVNQDRNAFWDYMEKHPESPLQDHVAGAYTGDISIDWALVIGLDDPEDKTLLDEIAGIGLKTDYRIEKGAGTKAYLEKCLPEIRGKLDALRDKVQNGTPTDEEKELIRRYQPRGPVIMRDMGKIWVEVTIKTPWYSIGEGWTEEDMYRDLEHCQELFYKLIGYEDVIGFMYGV